MQISRYPLWTWLLGASKGPRQVQVPVISASHRWAIENMRKAADRTFSTARENNNAPKSSRHCPIARIWLRHLAALVGCIEKLSLWITR